MPGFNRELFRKLGLVLGIIGSIAGLMALSATAAWAIAWAIANSRIVIIEQKLHDVERSKNTLAEAFNATQSELRQCQTREQASIGGKSACESALAAAQKELNRVNSRQVRLILWSAPDYVGKTITRQAPAIPGQPIHIVDVGLIPADEDPHWFFVRSDRVVSVKAEIVDPPPK